MEKPRRLLSKEVILRALCWRLDRPTGRTHATGRADDILAALETVSALLANPSGIREDEPAITAVLTKLKRPGDRRDPWGMLCALLALAAHNRGDWSAFYCAGLEVWLSYRQAQLGTLRELDRIGRPELADEKEQSPLAGEAKPLERAAKNLSHINAEMREVRRSDLSPAEKRGRLDELTAERNVLLKATVGDAQRTHGERMEK